MAKAKLEIDFSGINDVMQDFAKLDDGYLQKAVVNSLEKSKDYVNKEIEEAMDASVYSFGGEGYSVLRAQKGLSKIEKMDVQLKKNKAIAFAGVSFYDAAELWFIAHGGNGNPHSPIKDQRLYNAVIVKGNVKKEVERIQAEEFEKVIKEALSR